METLLFDDELLNFSLPDDEEQDQGHNSKNTTLSTSLLHPADDQNPSVPKFEEEELEWLLNKDSFPSLETAMDLFPPNQNNRHSPVSVLENSTSSSNSNSNSSTILNYCRALLIPPSFPVRSRSKRRRKRRRGFPDLPGHLGVLWNQVNVKNVKQELPKPAVRVSNGAAIGRRCQHCLTEKTPQWRAGPMGPKTLCNACGVRYKSGRLVPEYRPASSPTFSSELHSNSHRKIMEMRKHTTQMGEMMTNETWRYRVG